MADPTPTPSRPLTALQAALEKADEEAEVEEEEVPLRGEQFTAQDVTDEEAFEEDSEGEADELLPQEELVRDAPEDEQAEFGWTTRPAMTEFVGEGASSDPEGAYKRYMAKLAENRQGRNKELDRFNKRAKEQTLSERQRQRGVSETKGARKFKSHFQNPLSEYIMDNYPGRDASAEEVLGILLDTAANKGEVAGTGRLVPGAMLFRRVGEMPEWAQAEYENVLAAGEAEVYRVSATLGPLTKEQRESVYAEGIAKGVQQMTPAAQLAYARFEKENETDIVTPWTVEEMDLRAFLALNNFAQRELHTEYESPEHMLESFGEDYDRYLERVVTGQKFLEAARNNLTIDEFDDYQRAHTFLTDVTSKGKYASLAEQMQDADFKMKQASQEFTELLASVGDTPLDSDEYKFADQKAKLLDAQYRQAAAAYNKARQEILPVHDRIMSEQGVMLRLAEKLSQAKNASGVVGFHITQSEDGPSVQYSNKVSYFEDAEVQDALGNAMAWGTAERTLIGLDVTRHRSDFVDATEGFSEIARASQTEGGRADLVKVFGRRKGRELANVYDPLTWTEKFRPGDIKVPMGYDPITGRTLVDLNSWGNGLAYKYYVLEKRRLEEEAVPKLVERFGPRTERNRLLWSQNLNMIEQEALRIGWEKSRDAVERFRTSQITASDNFDPDRKLEGFFNATSVWGAIAAGGTGLANWSLGLPEKVIALKTDQLLTEAFKAATWLAPKETFGTAVMAAGLSPDEIGDLIPSIRSGEKTWETFTDEDWKEYFATDEWKKLQKKIQSGLRESRRGQTADILKRRTIPGGVARQTFALFMPHRKIAGTVEMNQYGEYNVTPGPIAEYSGQRSTQMDVALRMLGFGLEGVASSYVVANRQRLSEAPDAKTQEAMIKEGGGTDLILRMARLQGDDEVILNMTETSDSVGPMFQGFSRSLIGTAEEDKYKRGTISAMLFVSAFLDPGPGELLGATAKGSAAMRFNQPIRKLFGARTIDQMTEAAVALDKHLTERFGEWRTIDAAQMDELDAAVKQWLFATKGGEHLRNSVLARSIWRETVINSGHGASLAGKDHLSNASRNAENMQQRSQEVLDEISNTFDGTDIVPDDTAGALSRAERVQAQADLVEDLDTIAYRLRSTQEFVDGQVGAIAELSAYVDTLKTLDELESITDPVTGARYARRSDVVSNAINALRDLVSTTDGAGKTLSGATRGRMAMEAAEELADILGQGSDFAARLARLNGRPVDEVMTLINDALNTHRLELDQLAARASQLWPPSGRPAGMSKKELRVARRDVRDRIDDILKNHINNGADFSVLAATAKLHALQKALVPNLATLESLQAGAADFLSNINRLDNDIVNADDVRRVIDDLGEATGDAGVTVEALQNAAMRAADVQEASERALARTQSAFRDAVQDHVDVLLALNKDRTMGLRIQRTVDEGVLVDTRGQRMLDEAGQDIRSVDYVRIMDDEGFSRVLDSLVGPPPKPPKGEDALSPDVQAAYDAARIEAMEKLMGYTNVVAKMFEHPAGKIYKGGVGGMSSYAAELGGESIGFWRSFVNAMSYRSAPVMMQYTLAQFREGGWMYPLRSYFLKQLKTNYVQTSERLNEVTIRHKTLFGKIKDDISILIRAVGDEVDRSWSGTGNTRTIDGRKMTRQEAVQQAQRNAFKRALTHRGGVFEVVDPSTVGPNFVKARYHLRGLEASDTSLVQDALHYLLNSATLDPKQRAVMGAIDGQADLMNTQPFFYGITRAFRPDRAEVARAAGMSETRWKNMAVLHDREALNQIRRALSPQRARKASDSAKDPFTLVKDDAGKEIIEPVDVYTLNPDYVYEQVYQAVVHATEKIYGKDAARTLKPSNVALYHEAMLATAGQWRMMDAVRIELPGYRPKMAEAANTALDDTFSFSPISKEPFRVGDQVVATSKIRRIQNILGQPITTGEVAAMSAPGMGKIDDAVPLTKSPFDSYYDDISSPKSADPAAEQIKVKATPDITYAYLELDPHASAQIEKIVERGEKLPDGRIADDMYVKLDSGPEYVKASDFSRLSDYPGISYLDALNAFVYWGLKNVDGFLKEEKVGLALAMTRSMDVAYQRFVAHASTSSPMGPHPAPAQFYAWINDMTDDFMKTIDDVAEDNPTFDTFFTRPTKRTYALIKDAMLFGVAGGRWAMGLVQWFGDVTSLWQTLGTRQALRAGAAGAVGYLPIVPHQLYDKFALRMNLAAAREGYGWMPPVSFAFMDPTLAKVLSQDPDIFLDMGKRGMVDCKTLYNEMIADIGATNISSRNTSELIQRAAQRSIRRTEARAADGISDWTIESRPGLFAQDMLTTMKKQLKNAVSIGTERTRGSVWVDQMMKNNGNRRIARERLNYGLIDWTTGTSKLDMDILSLMLVFPTFVRGYVRQTGQMLFDVPSSSLGEFSERLMRGETGIQRMKAAHFGVKMMESQFLIPDPSVPLPKDRAKEYTLRSYYPEYNFDRPLAAFNQVSQDFRGDLSKEGFRYTHSYRVLPGIQSLVGLKNLIQVSLLMNAIYAGIHPHKQTDKDRTLDVVDDMIDGVTWGVISEIVAASRAMVTKEGAHKSPYGIKLSEGDKALLDLLGMSDTYELVPGQDRPRMNLYSEGVRSDRQSLAFAIVQTAKTLQLTPELRRAIAAASVANPDLGWDTPFGGKVQAPMAVREQLAEGDDIGARLEGMSLASGMIPRSYLGLDTAMSYDAKALKRTTDRVSRALDKDIEDAMKRERAERELERERIRRQREDEDIDTADTASQYELDEP